MSTNTTRIPWKFAYDAANQIKERLQPFCERIMIVGSVRREKETVGDLELCLIPKRDPGQPSFFGETQGPVCKGFVKVVNEFTRIKGQTDGRYLQVALTVKWNQGREEMSTFLKCDIFMPAPYDFGRIVAIRTGSAEFSKDVLAVGWKKLGWVGTHEGLRRQSECSFNEKNNKWVCKKFDPELPPEFHDEMSFFQFLHIPYIKPEERNG